MEQAKKKLIHKLRYKYKLVLINDESFEEKLSFKLTPMNVFIGFSSAIVLFTGLIITLIFYTTLREYVPGYTDTRTKRNLQELLYKTDSLEQVLIAKELYYKNIVNIIEGGTGLKDTVEKSEKPSSSNGSDKGNGSEMAFVKKYEEDLKKPNNSQTPLNFEVNPNKRLGVHLINPTSGIISRNYNSLEDHYAVDIASTQDAAVVSVQAGTIIIAEWTPQAGNTIVIQHENNLVSIYKHNSNILKKVGTFVELGEVIAMVGSTGEISTGPHLHFELWENGKSVNPLELLNYN